MLSFVLFNATDLGQAGSDFASLFGLAGLPASSVETWYYLRSYGILFLIGFVGTTPLLRNLCRRLERGRIGGKLLAVLEPLVLIGILLLCSAYLVDGSFNPFLYFRF